LLSICRYQLLPEASLASAITVRYAGISSLGQNMISTADELVKDLKASGFTDAQAEAVTRAVRQSQDFSDVATTPDVALLRRDPQGEMLALELRLIRWVVGVVVLRHWPWVA
jgi:hypothetical protein